MIHKLLCLLGIRPKLKLRLYRVWFEYSSYATVESVAWAKNEEDLYKVMAWTKRDRPKMEFKDITTHTGCIYSVTKFKPHRGLPT